eukprot:11287311-Alexandrium_andersonii.AAC.2
MGVQGCGVPYLLGAERVARQCLPCPAPFRRQEFQHPTGVEQVQLQLIRGRFHEVQASPQVTHTVSGSHARNTGRSACTPASVRHHAFASPSVAVDRDTYPC